MCRCPHEGTAPQNLPAPAPMGGHSRVPPPPWPLELCKCPFPAQKEPNLAEIEGVEVGDAQGGDRGTGGARWCPPIVWATNGAPPSPVFTVNSPNWSQLGQTRPGPAHVTPAVPIKRGWGRPPVPVRCHPLLAGCPPCPPHHALLARPARPLLVQPRGHVPPAQLRGAQVPPTPAAFGETEARPSAHPFRGGFSRRDPPVLPYLKQEEPNGISTSQPPIPEFQYILSAPTSPAVRHHQETLTYLNQGQSYEIRMMGTPRGDPAESRRMVKSVVRVVFHDR
uniref:Transcription factor CP2-like protein 1 n=1 Tax=Cyanistes caeruleus TaxID=156563 RepID=A0A8C0VJS4_CYACU